MSEINKRKAERSVTKFLPELAEVQFISLILLMCTLYFVRNSPEQSLVYLQYALILLPLIHMRAQRYTGGVKPGKIRGVFMFSYLFLALSFIINWIWMINPISLSMPLSGLLYVITLIPIFLCFYLVYPILKPIFRNEDSETENCVVVLPVLLLLVFLLYSLKIFKHSPMGFNDKSSIGIVIYPIIFLTILLLAKEVFGALRSADIPVRSKKFSEKNEIDAHDGEENRMGEEELIELAQRVESVLLKDDLFKLPSLSLADVSHKSGIPAYRLSYIFNTYFEKGFYQTLGEYRIRYAMELIKKNPNLSFDDLAEMCGFNSRSTFYKYFKMVNFCTPNEYLQEIKEQKTFVES